LDADQGQIIWESKKLRISVYSPSPPQYPSDAITRVVPIESIKELRSGLDARYYRQQFQLASEYEDRWITIIYILDGQYKTLHLIASSKDAFQLWDITLRKLHAIRQQLMTGLGNEEMRHAVWLRQCWKSSDQQYDQKLVFEEVERLCRRLNINSSKEDLLRLFKVCCFNVCSQELSLILSKQADSQHRGFLDFTDFQKFVKLLKARPELDLLYKKLCSGAKFTFRVFEQFMRDCQKACLLAASCLRLLTATLSLPLARKS